MQRRPDITTLVGEGFDFIIIDSEAVYTKEVEEMEQGNVTWGQTDIQFNNINPNYVLAIEAPNIALLLVQTLKKVPEEVKENKNFNQINNSEEEEEL